MKNEEWLDREIRSFVGAILHTAKKQGPALDPGIAPLTIAADDPPDAAAVVPPTPIRRPARHKKPSGRAKR